MITMISSINEDVAVALSTIDSTRRVYLSQMIRRFYFDLPRDAVFNPVQAWAIAEIVVKGAIAAGHMARPDGTPESQRCVEFATELLAGFIEQAHRPSQNRGLSA